MSHPMTRKERAARARFARHGMVFDSLSAITKDVILKEIAADLAAAYPEVHSDPPTAWLAPWEATEGMCRAAEATPYGQHFKRLVEAEGGRIVGSPVTAPVHGFVLVLRAFAAMRSAHLKDSRD